MEIGNYISNFIKPRLNNLLGSDRMVSFEDYFQKKVLYPSVKSNWLIAYVVLQWTLLIPLFLLVAYFVVMGVYNHWNDIVQSPQGVILTADIIVMVLVFRVNLKQHRIIKKK